MADAPKPRRRRPLVWLVAAAVLLALGAWLASLGEAPPPPPVVVHFPRPAWQQRHRRHVFRRAHPPVAARPDGGTRHEARDPMLAALRVTKGAMVLEANALRHSHLGGLVLHCLETQNPRFVKALAKARDKLKIDPLEQIDRVSMADQLFAVSGDFASVPFDTLFPNRGSEPYGDHGVIYDAVPGAGDDGRDMKSATIGVWNHQLLLVSLDPSKVTGAMDQIEGRGPAAPAVLGPSGAYGDAYGVMPSDAIADMVARDDPQLAERIRRSLDKVSLHVDAQTDVAMSAVVVGNGHTDHFDDLKRSIAGALSAARIKAETDGDTKLADLLDHAQVVGDANGGFTVDLALPESTVDDLLGDCSWARPVRRHRPRASADGGVPAQPAPDGGTPGY